MLQLQLFVIIFAKVSTYKASDMKLKTLLMISLTYLFASSAALGQSYNSIFEAAMSEKNRNIPRIDSILSIWEKSTPEATDLAIAKFERLLLDRYRQVITKAKDKNADNDSTYLITIDHVLDKDVVAKAYAIIDAAIDKFPDLFKLRQHKIRTNYKLGFYDEFIKDFDSAFKRQTFNKGRWIVSDTYYPELPRDEIFTNLAIGYINDIFGKDKIDIDLAEKLMETGLNYFPKEYRFLNVCGIIAANYRHDIKKGIEYYSMALSIVPDDLIVLLNLAHMKIRTGDNEEAIKIAEKVINSPEAPSQYIEEAKELIQFAKAEKTPVSLYSFEFKFTPILAANATSPFHLTNVQAIIDELLPSEGYAVEFRSDMVTDQLFTYGDKECVLWTFDTPTETPLCKYIAFIPVNEKFEVYTLEKTIPINDNANWVIGHVQTDGHSPVGGVKGFDSGEDFITFVLDNIVKEEESGK